ncbi:hypothetical protein QFZ97_005111 [Paraburkholderia youngii]
MGFSFFDVPTIEQALYPSMSFISYARVSGRQIDDHTERSSRSATYLATELASARFASRSISAFAKLPYTASYASPSSACSIACTQFADKGK